MVSIQNNTNSYLPNKIRLLSFYYQTAALYNNIMCTAVRILPLKPYAFRYQAPEMVRNRKSVVNSLVNWKI